MSTKRILSKMGQRKQRRGFDEEAKLKGKYGGKLVPGSGSRDKKGDIAKMFGQYRCESKTTSKGSYAISLKKWMQLEESAMLSGETPMMAISFYDDNDRKIETLCVVSMDAFEEALNNERA